MNERSRLIVIGCIFLMNVVQAALSCLGELEGCNTYSSHQCCDGLVCSSNLPFSQYGRCVPQSYGVNTSCRLI
ncbi:tachystatin-A2-like [Tachypleus tridentatus]|uniref:tachystatin-A2-like n=1 Tax=Tachypleus tridentatus TaxID=6853 RepID=UPI003FD671B2